MIIMLHGLPGTGKSFLADKLAKDIPNSIILKTVSYRKTELKGTERFDENNPVAKKEKDESYKLLLEETRKYLQKGKTPILDATFHKKYRREWFYALAKEMKQKIAIIDIIADEQKIKQRMQERKEKIDKDAYLDSWEAYKLMKEQADELEKEGNSLQVDSDEIERVVKWLKTL